MGKFVGGLVIGLMVAGFGGGSALLGPLVPGLIAEHGWRPVMLWLGAIYLVAMTLGAFTARVPADDWAPAGYTPATESDGMRTAGDVTAANAIRTRAFWLLWVVLFCNVTAGIGILEQASPMIQDFFRSDGGVSTVTRTSID